MARATTKVAAAVESAAATTTASGATATTAYVAATAVEPTATAVAVTTATTAYVAATAMEPTATAVAVTIAAVNKPLRSDHLCQPWQSSRLPRVLPVQRHAPLRGLRKRNLRPGRGMARTHHLQGRNVRIGTYENCGGEIGERTRVFF